MTRALLLAPFAVLLCVPAPAVAGPISYILRDAHFFGGVPGPTREVVQTGTLTPATSESLPYTFSTGGQSGTVFTGLATNAGGPFELTASNQVSAGSSVALQFNLPPSDPTNIVSIVQSRVQENGLVVTGGAGDGYLLPTFRVDGTFDDAHAGASASVAICAGIPSCPVTGLGFSSGGVQPLDVLYTPAIGDTTRFTFGQAFNLFFLLNVGITSSQVGTLQAGGPVGADFRLRLVGYRIVDAQGVDIGGASLTSDLLNPVPEPVTVALTAIGLAAVIGRRARRPLA